VGYETWGDGYDEFGEPLGSDEGEDEGRDLGQAPGRSSRVGLAVSRMVGGIGSFGMKTMSIARVKRGGGLQRWRWRGSLSSLGVKRIIGRPRGVSDRLMGPGMRGMPMAKAGLRALRMRRRVGVLAVLSMADQSSDDETADGRI